jgi:hypothetical protein
LPSRYTENALPEAGRVPDRTEEPAAASDDSKLVASKG